MNKDENDTVNISTINTSGGTFALNYIFLAKRWAVSF